MFSTMLLPIFFSILASAIAMQDVLDHIPVMDQFIDPRISTKLHPDAYLTTLELVNKHGFNGELHKVTTTDGYILELHRITGRHNSSAVQKPIALVMHGFLASSAAWVLSGPENGLAFILADAGYDVWLGNVRGSTYSRKHRSSAILDKDYWNFSWHEMGIHDLPAMIDYTLKTTGRDKLFYLGHSQGTTAFFVMASELPKYQDKIEAMFALAPIAYMSKVTNPFFRFLTLFTKQINVLRKLLGAYEFKPSSESMKKFMAVVCGKDAITQPLCANIFFLINGFNSAQFNNTLLPIILGHVPSSASTLQYVHYAQLVRSGYFRQYDYSLIQNWKEYRRLTPPSYDLRKIKTPISLHYSNNDWLAHSKDVHKLYHELGNPYGKFRVVDEKFNHIDFMWAKDVKTLLYDKILSLMTHFKR